MCTCTCRSSGLVFNAVSFMFSYQCTCRQQIEDLEGKVKILKEQMKKKEENEAKYQGKRVPPLLMIYSSALYTCMHCSLSTESLAQLNTIAEQQAKELASLKVSVCVCVCVCVCTIVCIM